MSRGLDRQSKPVMSEAEFDSYLSLMAKFLRLRSRQKDALADELRDHLESRLDELLAQGKTREQAVSIALEEFGDAAVLAKARDYRARQAHFETLRDELGKNLYRSIAITIADRKLDYVPGSMEWADFDPTATTTAVMLLDIERGLPPGILGRTYDEYLKGLRKRRDGEIDWDKYTAYEIRNICAMLRLRRRADVTRPL